MARKDSRQLREEASAAAAAGKHKRALDAYLELERLEARDAQWPKRAAEVYRRLGKNNEAIAAYDRAVERYVQGGFLVQAIAVCKVILQLDPNHVQTQHRLASFNEQADAGPTRIGSLADGHPSLHANPAVQMIRERGSTTAPPVGSPSDSGPFRAVSPTTPPPSFGGARASNDLELPPSEGNAELEIDRSPSRQRPTSTMHPPMGAPHTGSPSSPQPLRAKSVTVQPPRTGSPSSPQRFTAPTMPPAAPVVARTTTTTPPTVSRTSTLTAPPTVSRTSTLTAPPTVSRTATATAAPSIPRTSTGTVGPAISRTSTATAGPAISRTATPTSAPRPATPTGVLRAKTPTATPFSDTPSRPDPRSATNKPATAPPPIGTPRPRRPTPPIKLDPGAALERVNLGNLISGSRQHRHDGSEPGIMVIPLDEPEAPNNFDDFNDYAGATVAADDTQSYDAHMAAIAEKKRQQSDVAIEIETFAYNAAEDDDVHEIDSADVDEPEELNLDDLEEMPLERKPLSATARRAMANTPLFAGLAPSALEALIARIELKSMLAGELLFREGDAGDALYIVSEGEVAVQSEGPPRVELVRLGSGAFFGEVALLTDQPRSATVTALAPTELLRIDRDVLRAILAEHPDVLPVVLRFVRDRLVDRMIRTSPLFRPFDDTERASLAARFRFLEIDKGAVIIPAGSKPDGLYILLAGRVEIRPANSSPIVLGSGDLIGEGSLLTGSKATDEVVATGKCLALCLPAAEFRELIMTHPHVLEYVGDQADARSRIQML